MTFVAVCVLSACAFGQFFECAPTGPLPNDPTFSCEGIASNNLGALTGVTSAASCGFPTQGLQYLQITANGPIAVPVGGPFPRPASTNVTEVRIPIPVGATTVSMDWEFFNRECPGAPQTFYDGMSIDVVDQFGNLLQNLAYADTASPEGICTLPGSDYCGGPISEVLPNGANPLLAVLPTLVNCEYLSIVVWNGGDNAVASVGYVDNIQFNTVGPACPVPCFVIQPGPPTLAFSSPSGATCVKVDLTNMPGAGFYFLGVTLQSGTFPNGWFFGIDIGFPELQNEINTGFPFLGSITGSACSAAGAATIGEFCGVPSGLTLYAVGLGIPNGSSFPTAITSPTVYTIP